MLTFGFGLFLGFFKSQATLYVHSCTCFLVHVRISQGYIFASRIVRSWGIHTEMETIDLLQFIVETKLLF